MAEVMKFDDFKQEGSETAVKVMCRKCDAILSELITGGGKVQTTGKELCRRRWRHHSV